MLFRNRYNISLLDTEYFKDAGPTTKRVYTHLLLSCSNSVGVVKSSIIKIALATGLKSKEVERIINNLSADDKIFLCDNQEIVLMDYPEYLPSQGTLASTLLSIASDIAQIENLVIKERVKESFRRIGVHTDEIETSRTPPLSAIKTKRKELSLPLFTNNPTTCSKKQVSPVAIFTPKRSRLSVTEDEVDRYVEIYDEIFGDISPIDRVPGERKGVSKERRALIKRRVAEMGPEWESKLTDILQKASQSPFLRGEKTDFRLTFGWLTCSQEKHQRIAEGTYSGNPNTNPFASLCEFAKEQGVSDPVTLGTEGANS